MSSSSSTFPSGGSPTAAQVNGWAQGTLGYVSATANQTGIGAGPADVTSLTVTFTVVAGRRIRLTVLIDQFNFSDATTAFTFDLVKDAGGFGRLVTASRLNTVDFGSGYAALLDTPSAGSHTYKVTTTRYVGAGTMSIFSTATNVSYLLAEDLGAT